MTDILQLTMTTVKLQEKLYEFIKPKYPDILIKVEDTTDNIRQLYFTDDNFKLLYPKQRYHYLVHSIPKDFYDQNLQNATWFELAPGENPNELEYHDEETIIDIKDSILSILKDKVDFFKILDKEFDFQKVKCFGDFRNSKKILKDIGFSDEDKFDIFHVLMNEGAYCDCEILFNVFKESEYSKKYWRNRQP
ncbi:MAG: DUF2695 domain-containing protein [Ginsengibacter sp.]